MYTPIITYSDFENSAIFETLQFRILSKFPGYLFYVDAQNILLVALQLKSFTPKPNSERITSMRIIPIGEKIFESGMAYLGFLAIDFIYGNRACENDELRKEFGRTVTSMTDPSGIELIVDKKAFHLTLYGQSEDKMGFQCDTADAREWTVPMDTAHSL
jgi:hypothetical protein